MSAFLIILGVPLLGVLLYSAELTRRMGETPRTRALGKIGVLLCGLALGAVGVALIVQTAQWIVSGDVPSILMALLSFVAQSIAGALMLWAAACAWQVFRLPPESFDGAGDLRRERTSERLRLSAALLMLVPLLLLGVFGVFAAVPLVLWGVAFRAARLGRQSQLLWTLSLAVRQELPLDEEIEMFARPLASRQRARYQTLANRLRDGRSLGESLEMSTGILSRSVAGEIRMAEQAGRLPGALTDLATRSTTSLSQNRSSGAVAVTILYGWSLLLMFVFVLGFLMYWIIPKYKNIFQDFGTELPPLTLTAVHASDLVVDNVLLVMPLIGLPLMALVAITCVYFASWENMNFPLLMRWFPRCDAPALLRTLSHPVGSGLPLPSVVQEMAHRHLRADLRMRLARIGNALEEGVPLWSALDHEGFIRPVEAQALAAAQRAGNLPWAMRTIAESMDQVVRRRTLFLLEIMKPAVVIGVGLLVGWFVIAMFLPLVHLITTLV